MEPNSFKFNCELHDKYLYQTLQTLSGSFAAADIKIKYEETKTIDNKFFYCIKNINNNLEGYIGRDINTNKIVYLIKDAGLMNWAIKEGFYDKQNVNDNNLLIIDNVNLNIMKRVININSFISFISGNKDYTLDTSPPAKSKQRAIK